MATLPHLPALAEIDLSYNAIDSVATFPVPAALPALTRLDLGYNAITDLRPLGIYMGLDIRAQHQWVTLADGAGCTPMAFPGAQAPASYGMIHYGPASAVSGNTLTWLKVGDHELGWLSMMGYFSGTFSQDVTTPCLTFTSTSTPVITGVSRVGRLQRIVVGTWGPAPFSSVQIQWNRDGVPIARATGMTYRPTWRDRRHHLTVTITVSKVGYMTVSLTSASKKIK